MDNENFRRLVQLVPLAFFRLQAASDKVHAARDLSTGLRGLLLSLEEHGPMTAARLADMRPVSRQAIHKLAEQLIERGLIRQTDNPRDGRAPLLVLAEKGRAEITRLRTAEDPQLARLFNGVSASDIEAATRVLDVMCDRLAPEEWRRVQRGDRLRTEKLPARVRRRAR